MLSIYAEQWVDWAEGGKRLTMICDQQGDAIAAGREIARKQHSELRQFGFAQIREIRVKKSWRLCPFAPLR